MIFELYSYLHPVLNKKILPLFDDNVRIYFTHPSADKEEKMAERKEQLHRNESSGAPIRILGTNPNNPEDGKILLWTKAGWFERIENQSGDVSFTLVAKSADELKDFVERDLGSVKLFQLGPEYRRKVSEEFTGQSMSSDLEIYYATERERKNKLLTTIGISLIIIGLLVFGVGIYFRLTYSPINFKADQYSLLFRQVYSAGLSGILAGGIKDVFGWIFVGLSNGGKR